MIEHGGEAWWATVFSDTAAPYFRIAPAGAPDAGTRPAPETTGFDVHIGLQTAGAPVSQVLVRLILDGVDHYVPADRTVRGRFEWYEARVRIRQASTRYHFLLRTTDGRTVYYDRAGVRSTYPNEDYDFTVNPAHEIPEWVRSAVFYQIVPDRFHRGDRSLGVRTNEIFRGPFASREMTWDEEPLPYPLGGSLDFFNGDLPGIESRLDYLDDLGVNAIYLTPVFTAKTNHRYDCLDYFSVDPHLGGDAALASLVHNAHRRGMRVILDVSINHIGVEHPWANGMPCGVSTVDVVARHPDGSPINWAGVPELLKLDYSVPALRDRVYRDDDSVVQRYLRPPFEIDGWRFDVASEVGRHGPAQLGHDVWREIRSVIRRINPQAYIVGEHWHDSRDYLQGDQWDSAMNYFACGRPIRLWCGEQDRFAVSPAAEAVRGRPITGAQLHVLLLQHFGRIPSAAVPAQFNLFDSHDVVRLHTLPWMDPDRYAGAVMLLFMLPGPACVYYGDETGLRGTADGDHGKRFPMEWDESCWNHEIRSLYRTLIRLKRNEPALAIGGFRTLEASDDYFVAARCTGDSGVVLVLNRAETDRSVRFDLSRIGASSCTDVIGGDTVPVNTDGTIAVRLRARASRLIRCRLS